MKSGDVLLIIKYQLKSEIFKYVEACNFCFKVRQFCVCVCGCFSNILLMS